MWHDISRSQGFPRVELSARLVQRNTAAAFEVQVQVQTGPNDINGHSNGISLCTPEYLNIQIGKH